MASTPDITDVVLPLPESATVPEVAAFSDAVDAPRAGAASTPARGAPSLAWTPRTNEQTKQGLDKDGSGTVDYTELQQVYNKFDRDGDGVIDKGELVEVIQGMVNAGTCRSLSAEEIQKMMNDADLNCDGQIDFGEFVRMAQGTLAVDLHASCFMRCRNSSWSLLRKNHPCVYSVLALVAPLQAVVMIFLLVLAVGPHDAALTNVLCCVVLLIACLGFANACAGRPSSRATFMLFALLTAGLYAGVLVYLMWLNEQLCASTTHVRAGKTANATTNATRTTTVANANPECVYPGVLLVLAIMALLLLTIQFILGVTVVYKTKDKTTFVFSSHTVESPWQLAIGAALVDDQMADAVKENEYV